MIAACLTPREVTPTKLPLPPNACDTHAHVFGPADRFVVTNPARLYGFSN